MSPEGYDKTEIMQKINQKRKNEKIKFEEIINVPAIYEIL